MAVLDGTARTEVFRGLMRYWSKNEETTAGIVKADLYDPGGNTGAVAETDDWIDGNDGANITVDVGYNNQLNVNARGLTATQKTIIFVAVASRRVNKKALRQVLAVEVD